MKVYDRIKDMLCDELENVSKQNELTPGNLDMIDTSIDIIKDIHTIEAMEKEYGYSGDGGYSQGFYGRMPIYMYDDMPRMDDGRSYAGGRASNAPRDSRGRYMSNGYSGDTKEELQRLMNTAKDEREREAIRNALEHINR